MRATINNAATATKPKTAGRQAFGNNSMAERVGLLGAARLAPSGPPFGRYPTPLRRITISRRRAPSIRQQFYGGESGIRTHEHP
jgi:hypothetical protein